AEHLTAVLERAVRRLDGAAVLDAAQDVEQLGGLDLVDRLAADPGEYVAFETAEDAIAVARYPVRRELGVPLARDGLEGALAGTGDLCGPACLTRVDAGVELPAQSEELLAGGLEGDLGVDPERRELLLTPESELDVPPLAPGGLDPQVEPV